MTDKIKNLFSEACKQINLKKYIQKNIDLDTCIEKLIAYIAHLQKWNKVYNLTAITDTQDIAIKHIIDCLAVLPQLHQAIIYKNINNNIKENENLAVLDVGSGAGLPSIVWAILQPQWIIYSIDSVHKKIAFQQHIKINLSLSNLYPMHQRIQDIKIGEHIAAPLNIITARAYAHTNDIIQQTQHLLAMPTNIAAYALLKGKDSHEFSLNNADYINNTEYVVHKYNIDVPFLDAQRHLMYIHKKQ